MAKSADSSPKIPAANVPIILVTGDVVVDHHIYVGEQSSAKDTGDGKRQTCEYLEFGGAALIEGLLLRPADGSGPQWTVKFGLEKDPECYPQTFATWEPHDSPLPDHKGKYWLATAAGYGRRCTAPPPGTTAASALAANADPDRKVDCGPERFGCPQKTPEADGKVDVLVVDDAGIGFRDRPASWPKCLDTADDRLPWMVWKMAGDPGGGLLWKHIRKLEGFAARHLILIVSATDLRRHGMDVTVGLSWERSVLDVLRGLEGTTFEPLKECAHLIVSFPDAGALWINRQGRKDDDKLEPDEARETVTSLVYDPSGGEGVPVDPRKPKAFGYQACLSAGVVWCVASTGAGRVPKLDDGLRRGLTARRKLFAEGHGELTASRTPTGFPAGAIHAGAIAKDPDPSSKPMYAVAEVPGRPRAASWPPSEEWPPDDWTIAQQAMKAPGPFYDVATAVMQRGLDALPALPHLKIGDYQTIERGEIEAIRRLRRRAREYDRAERQKRPFAITVFGAPGAGKSFIVEELAKGLLATAAPFLVFNLSQFSDEQDLHGAFHRVRDEVLKGQTPVVFWDEFDSQNYRWLRLLLAPLQDGKFRDGQISHPIGKSIFVFAGATSCTFEEFGEFPAGPQSDLAWHWTMAKGPDFKSRVHAHLDVLGPNQREHKLPDGSLVPDNSDACFPIRRALFLRGCWKLGQEKKPDRKYDLKLAQALLRVPKYTNGSRSFDRVLASLAAAPGAITPEALPPREDLELDISKPADVRTLMESARDRGEWDGVTAKLQVELEARLDEFAARINQVYMNNAKELRSADVTFAYDSLSLFLRESNRAAVRRLPAVLLAAGLEIVDRGTTGSYDTKDEALGYLAKGRLDLAAAKEHEKWCAFHRDRGWVHDPALGTAKDQISDPPRHGLLITWDEMTDEKNRNKDRDQVKHYVEIVYDEFTPADELAKTGKTRFALKPVKPVP